MASHIRWGIRLLGLAEFGNVRVLTKVAAGTWAILEISAGDLLLLSTSEVFPKLDSAHCVVLGRSGKDCLEKLADEQERRKALAILDSLHPENSTGGQHDAPLGPDRQERRDHP
jgi:hypothetical protein